MLPAATLHSDEPDPSGEEVASSLLLPPHPPCKSTLFVLAYGSGWTLSRSHSPARLYVSHVPDETPLRWNQLEVT